MGNISRYNIAFKEYIKEAIAFGISTIVWLASTYYANWSDPQSASFYWKGSYPLLIVLSGILGMIFPDRPWRWALYLISAQFGMGIITATGGLNLLPIGVIIHLLMALPLLMSSYAGAWISRAWEI
jgi:hypothetical protein